MARTAIDNATEFGRHSRGGGWTLGLLVACSVEPADGKSRGPRDIPKMSAAAFAAHRQRVVADCPQLLRRMGDGRIAPRRPRTSTLTPSDVDLIELPVGYDWSGYIDHRTGHSSTHASRPCDRRTGRVRGRRDDDAETAT